MCAEVAEQPIAEREKPKKHKHRSHRSTSPHEPHREHHHHRKHKRRSRSCERPTDGVAPRILPPVSTKTATETLLAQLQRILRADTTKEGYRVEPDEDSIYRWEVYLFDFAEGTQMREDLDLYMNVTNRDAHVKMEILFPPNYPVAPPFLRVVYPRFHQWTGHITIGGSVCVKDLTLSGWNAQNDLAAFIVMIRSLLVAGHALINLDNVSDYTEAEAREAFHRVAKAHGWAT